MHLLLVNFRLFCIQGAAKRAGSRLYPTPPQALAAVHDAVTTVSALSFALGPGRLQYQERSKVKRPAVDRV